MKSILIKLFVSIVFFAGGLTAYLYITKPMADEARASETWPSVEGEIIRSEINSFYNSEGREMYSPDVAYIYQLNGKDYSGSKISDVEEMYCLFSLIEIIIHEMNLNTRIWTKN